jgi:hypothetical protein
MYVVLSWKSESWGDNELVEVFGPFENEPIAKAFVKDWSETWGLALEIKQLSSPNIIQSNGERITDC